MLARRIGLLCLAILCGQVVGDDKKKPEDRARDTVAAFTKALKAKDVDALMKISDVPFCHDGKEIFKERDQLQEMFAKNVKKQNFADVKFDIQDVGTLEELEKKAGKKLKEEKRDKLVEVLGKEHRVVLIEIDDGEQKHKAGLAIRLDGDKAVIVAIVK